MKRSPFLFLFFFSFLVDAKQEIGSVTFSWDATSEVRLVARYKGQELHPLVAWHKNGKKRKSFNYKKKIKNLVRNGQLMAGRCFRANKIRFNFWQYIKSFFWKPVQVGSQTYVLFDDGLENYNGPKGRCARIFVSDARKLFCEWEELRTS